MLEIHSLKNQIPVKEKTGKAKRSKLWLFVSLGIFTIFIFGILYVLLRFRFLYLPGLSQYFGGDVFPDYRLSVNLSEPIDLSWKDWKLQDGFTILTLSEERATTYLREYFDSSWQIIFQDGGFEVFGNLYSSVNNVDYWSQVKINYVLDSLQINLNGISVPQLLNNYVLNYMISTDPNIESEKYFEKINFSDKKIMVYFSSDQWGALMKDFNSEEFFQSLIKFLIYSN